MIASMLISVSIITGVRGDTVGSGVTVGSEVFEGGIDVTVGPQAANNEISTSNPTKCNRPMFVLISLAFLSCREKYAEIKLSLND